MRQNWFTSESVGPGHPDKICDQISDAILDACLAKDPHSFVACEVFASNRLIVIGGEITTTAYVDIVREAWKVLLPLGYTENDFTIISNIHTQSPDINQAVTKSAENVGAGDQGIVFGYACDETKSYLPLGIVLAHQLVKRLERARKNRVVDFIGSDMKSQVTVDYSHPQPRIAIMLVSVQHHPKATQSEIHAFVGKIMDDLAREFRLNSDFEKIINPSGRFTIGGPIGDTGLTGRKVIVDTYGGMARHGGGAFSGKDPTKVDRSGAYMARYIAKNIVGAGLARRCEVQLGFAIGWTRPISIHVETFGTGWYDDATLEEMIPAVFDLEISHFIQHLNLYKIKYQPLAVYGHFGRNPEKYPWERLDQVEAIRAYYKEKKENGHQEH